MTTVEIRPKGAHFAKSCPQRVQLDVLRPCEPLPDSPFLQKLVRAGEEYEVDSLGELFDGVDGVVTIDADDPDAREWHTQNAIAEGARIIAGGRLPVDVEAHRVGEPDLLVRCGDGYVPIDVKSHKSLDRVKREGTGTALVSDFAEPFYELAVVDAGMAARRNVGDLLQLAHYRRLLEVAGWAPTGSNVAGIYGSEGVVVWYDLDALLLDAPEHIVPTPVGPLSPMARYDLEFAHRSEVAAAAEAHRLDESVALLAEPIVCSSCDLCKWREWCGEELEAASDLSLISGIGVARRRLYKSEGVEDLQDLAALDWRAAELVRRDVDLLDLTVKACDASESTRLDTLIPRRKKQLDDLTALGVVTVADLDGLDQRTIQLADDASNLAGQIELAKARVGASPAYRRRGVERVEVLRGDVEVDVDMESTNDGCYLWGALLTDRRVPGSPSTHFAFPSWDADIEAGELVAFEDFWRWFRGVRETAHAEGATFRAYCYSRSAEQRQMTRLADRLGLRGEVDEFLGSDEWVDLYDVVKAQLVTGRSMGLKVVAPLAGFEWRFDDAGGTLAMVKYDQAVDDEYGSYNDGVRRVDAQQWILDYNEDDVRATAALREWLDGSASALPSIADA